MNFIDSLEYLNYFQRSYGNYGICLNNFLDIQKGDIIGISMQLTDEIVIEKYYNPNLCTEECIEILGNVSGNIKLLPDGGKYNIYTYKMKCSIIKI